MENITRISFRHQQFEMMEFFQSFLEKSDEVALKIRKIVIETVIIFTMHVKNMDSALMIQMVYICILINNIKFD